MKQLFFDGESRILYKKNGETIRYTDIVYLPDGWQGLEGEALAQWGIENVENRFAVQVFLLFLEEEKIEIYFAHNGEYKVMYNGSIFGYRGRLDAQNKVNEILEKNGKEPNYVLGANSKYDVTGEFGSRYKELSDTIYL